YDRRSTFGGFFSGTRCAGYLEKYWKDEFIEENDKKRIDDFVSRLNTQEGFFHYYLQLWCSYSLVISESDEDKNFLNKLVCEKGLALALRHHNMDGVASFLRQKVTQKERLAFVRDAEIVSCPTSQASDRRDFYKEQLNKSAAEIKLLVAE